MAARWVCRVSSAYTCWETISNARETNYGTRIDYVLASRNLVPGLATTLAQTHVVDCRLLVSVRGSDHCPVVSEWQGTPTAQHSHDVRPRQSHTGPGKGAARSSWGR